MSPKTVRYAGECGTSEIDQNQTADTKDELMTNNSDNCVHKT